MASIRRVLILPYTLKDSRLSSDVRSSSDPSSYSSRTLHVSSTDDDATSSVESLRTSHLSDERSKAAATSSRKQHPSSVARKIILQRNALRLMLYNSNDRVLSARRRRTMHSANSSYSRAVGRTKIDRATRIRDTKADRVWKIDRTDVKRSKSSCISERLAIIDNHDSTDITSSIDPSISSSLSRRNESSILGRSQDRIIVRDRARNVSRTYTYDPPTQ